MIELLQQKRMQIDEISGHLEGRDLARSVGHMLIARREPIDHECAVRGPGSLDDDVLARAERTLPSDQFTQSGFLFL